MAKKAQQEVNEVIKLTEEELTTLQTFGKNAELILKEFGQIGLLRLQLEKRETAAEEAVAANEANQLKFTQGLQETYGKGNINIETGEFTPIE